MISKMAMFSAAALVSFSAPLLAAAPTDPQIAHIAYTAGNIDIAAGKQALARSHNPAVRSFAQDLEWDSLTVLDFVANVEDEFDVLISMNMQAEIETVGQLVDALEKLQA